MRIIHLFLMARFVSNVLCNPQRHKSTRQIQSSESHILPSVQKRDSKCTLKSSCSHLEAASPIPPTDNSDNTMVLQLFVMNVQLLINLDCGAEHLPVFPCRTTVQAILKWHSFYRLSTEARCNGVARGGAKL